MQENINSPRGVLFDLDGTLADTAPDLAHAVNLQRLARGMEALALEQLSPFVSQGARGLLGKAFGITPEHSDYELLRTEFLRNYEDALCVESQLFSGVRALLAELDAQGYLWGVVTNKVERYALPLLKQLQLDPMVVVGGDTTAHSK
ncbi:MAG: HAD hydrolase-like protein, partial [Ottowia sp.]|nr:HAD hydrolase-like protein [Ottowia sp.]